MDLVTSVSNVYKFKKWILNMFWIFKNLDKVRMAAEKAITNAPFCPRHEARMVFKDEVPYFDKTRVKDTFQRNYKCPLCNYETYNIYSVKRD